MESWGILDMNSANTSKIYVGLFGYDMSCFANYCALQSTDD